MSLTERVARVRQIESASGSRRRGSGESSQRTRWSVQQRSSPAVTSSPAWGNQADLGGAIPGLAQIDGPQFGFYTVQTECRDQDAACLYGKSYPTAEGFPALFDTAAPRTRRLSFLTGVAIWA